MADPDMARVRLAVLALSLAGWSLLIGILGGVLGPTIALLAYFSSRKAISDEWAREWAAQRPVVYPVSINSRQAERRSRTRRLRTAAAGRP